MSLGERLLMFRKDKGYTREKAASMLSISFSSLEKWETNKRTPSLKRAKQLAEFYGITVNDLIGDSLLKKEENEKLLDIALKFKDVLLTLDSMDPDRSSDLSARIKSTADFFPPKDAATQVKKMS
jgi:transcriptional regulator with XRE-family HTH domain